MSNNHEFVKNYSAGAAVAANRIVKPGAADNEVIVGAAVSDALIGVSTDIAADSGERCDVIHAGIAPVKLGGTVARGDPITSDGTGQGVAAAPAAGTNNRIVGFALNSGVSGDIIPVLLAPSRVQG